MAVGEWLQSAVGSNAPYVEGESTVHQVGLSCNPIPPKGYGGIESMIGNLTEELAERGVPTVCYCPSPFGIEGATHYETLETRSPGPKDGNEDDPANTEEHLARVAEGLRENYRPGDVIHLHHSDHYPYLREQLSPLNPFKQYHVVESVYCNHAAYKKNRVYCSNALREFFDVDGEVIYTGVDLSLFDAPDAAPESEEYVLFPGRVTPSKGVHIAAEAADRYGIELRIAGPVMDEEYARTFADAVTFLGELEKGELIPQYQNAKAVVYMSQFREPIGIATIEAMACGTPVITSGKGGTSETVIDGETGFVCDDVDDVVEALDRVEDVSAGRCRERAEAFEKGVMAEQYLDYYARTFGE